MNLTVDFCTITSIIEGDSAESPFNSVYVFEKTGHNKVSADSLFCKGCRHSNIVLVDHAATRINLKPAEAIALAHYNLHHGEIPKHVRLHF